MKLTLLLSSLLYDCSHPENGEICVRNLYQNKFEKATYVRKKIKLIYIHDDNFIILIYFPFNKACLVLQRH